MSCPSSGDPGFYEIFYRPSDKKPFYFKDGKMYPVRISGGGGGGLPGLPGNPGSNGPNGPDGFVPTDYANFVRTGPEVPLSAGVPTNIPLTSVLNSSGPEWQIVAGAAVVGVSGIYWVDYELLVNNLAGLQVESILQKAPGLYVDGTHMASFYQAFPYGIPPVTLAPYPYVITRLSGSTIVPLQKGDTITIVAESNQANCSIISSTPELISPAPELDVASIKFRRYV
jgi:hypothetical protein